MGHGVEASGGRFGCSARPGCSAPGERPGESEGHGGWGKRSEEMKGFVIVYLGEGNAEGSFQEELRI